MDDKTFLLMFVLAHRSYRVYSLICDDAGRTTLPKADFDLLNSYCREDHDTRRCNVRPSRSRSDTGIIFRNIRPSLSSWGKILGVKHD